MLPALLLTALAATSPALAPLREPGPLSPRIASYRIEATLDPGQHTVKGKQTIHFVNRSGGEVPDLTFHLYMNAFKNERSTFFRESRGRHRGNRAEAHGWGAIDVTRLTVGGIDLTARFAVDDTLGRVALPRPLLAGQALDLEVEFTVTLPKVFARTGYHEDFYAVAQWFPKLGVFDCVNEVCGWRAHQHHLLSEFFADYGVYDVTVHVPAGWEVAATGVRVSDESSATGRTLVYRAEDVHDFVFAASPRFQVHEEIVKDPLGDLRVVLYAWPGHEALVPRHFATVRSALAEYTRRLGPYPYAQLSVVDVPLAAAGAGGMEYPTLFFTVGGPIPRGLHFPELVTAHELGHEWFYGLVASDEVEEAWLDEGFTEALTDWALSGQFGRDHAVLDLFGLRLPFAETSRLAYRRRADLDPPATVSFEFIDPAAYGNTTYRKTNLVLRTLDGLIGAARVEAGLRRYYQEWRFRHPRGADFRRSFDAGAGVLLDWYWQKTLEGTATFDAEVLSVEVAPAPRPAGLFEADGGARSEVTVPPDEKAPWRSEVLVARHGELVLPMDIRVVFSDGTERRERWDGGRAGGRRWTRLTYEGERKVVLAEVDPDSNIPLDLVRWNNGKRAEPDRAPRRRLIGLVQGVLSALLGWVGP